MNEKFITESNERHTLRVLDIVNTAKASVASVKTPSIDEIKVIAEVAAKAISRLPEHLDNDERGAVLRHAPGIIGLGVMLTAWATRREEG